MLKFVSIFALVVLLTLPGLLEAQCSMCKAVVESNAQTGDNIVEGVNSAILYLMGIPYALIAFLGFMWYKKFGKTEESN